MASGPAVAAPQQCRICYEGAEEHGETLISPCSCTGSLRFVHASCLNQWRVLNLDNENRLRCQLCRAPFRLVRRRRAAVTERAFWTDLVSQRWFYEAAIGAASAGLLVPLAFGALHVSRFIRRDDLYVSGPADMAARPWRARAFHPLLPKWLLADINLFILGAPPDQLSRLALFVYGLSKLGSYGCTLWLFSDGLARVFPIHVRMPNGERRPSPVLAVAKALVEFYGIPFCLRTPQSRVRLPFFLGTSSIGVWFIWFRMQARLRAIAAELLPRCKELELGELAAT